MAYEIFGEIGISSVIVVIEAGQIGQAIARRVGVGKRCVRFGILAGIATAVFVPLFLQAINVLS